jgi:hypothetical protein
VKPACTLCFGSSEVPYPSSPVLTTDYSCGEIRDELLKSTPDLCIKFQSELIAYAIECGCDQVGDWSADPTDALSMPPTFGGCVLCPDGSNVLKPEELSFDTNGLGANSSCATLASFVESSLTENDCSSQRDSLDINAVKCGCPGVESGRCSLCPDRSFPGNPNAFHSGGNQTCGELHELLLYTPADQCVEQ